MTRALAVVWGTLATALVVGLVAVMLQCMLCSAPTREFYLQTVHDTQTALGVPPVYVIRQEVRRGPDRVVFKTYDLGQALTLLRFFNSPGPAL